MIKLSAVIVSSNTEKNIDRCRESLKDLADEVVVVNSLLNFDLVQHEHVLWLSADDVLSENLYEEIKKVKAQFSYDGYEFNCLTIYNGAWVRHSGQTSDSKVRLVKKSKVKWNGGLKIDGNVGRLNGDLLHYSFDSISAHVLQTNKLSTVEARDLFSKGQTANVSKLVTRPFGQFFKDYILRKGFLDGRYGFIICFINSLYVLLKYAKMMDMQLNKKT